MNRKKFIFSVFTIFIITGFFIIYTNLLTSPSKAQNNLVWYKSEPIEMNIDALYIPCEDPADPDCQPFPAGAQHPVPAKQDHEIQLSTSNLPPNTNVYLVSCVNTVSGTKCTTGNPTHDAFLNGIPGGDFMDPDPAHEFKALQNPATTNASGELSVIVRSYTPSVTSHIFNGYLVENQDTSPTIITKNLSITPAKSLKLDSFEIITPTPLPTKKPKAPRPAKRSKELDPKGRVFDAKSLEPINSSEITLLDSTQKLYNYQSITNPQTVMKNGEFAFYVPNGLYYLNVSQLPQTHTWPVDLNMVNPNFSQAYFCDPDIKDSKNQPVSLYYQSFPINVSDKLIHCDIPLDPGSNPPFTSQVQLITYGINRESGTGDVTYSGKVTHPLSKIRLTGETTGYLAGEAIADKMGNWRINVPGKYYPVTKDNTPDRLEINFIKKDLTTGNFMEAVKDKVFEPILYYLEGYAYDQFGSIIPNAKVGIKSKTKDQIVYLTQADNKGFFRVGSQFLPSMEYELVFVDQNDKVGVLTTSQFALLNSDYIKEKKIDLISEPVNDLPLANQGISGPKSVNAAEQEEIIPTDTIVAPDTSNTQSRLLTLILLPLLLIIGAILVWLKFFRKKPAITENPPV
jgi:hypothetical protein